MKEYVQIYIEASSRLQLLWGVILFFLSIIAVLLTYILLKDLNNSFLKNRRNHYKKDIQQLLLKFINSDFELRDQHKNDIHSFIGKSNLRRKLFVENLILFHSKFKGNSSLKFEWLYKALDFDTSAFKKLSSKNTNKQISGIRELSQMNVRNAVIHFKSLIKNKNINIKLEAIVGSISINKFKALDFLDECDFYLSYWHQLSILDKLNQQVFTELPDPTNWLQSNNDSVVSFAAKFVLQFNLINHSKVLYELSQNHSNQSIRLEIVKLLGRYENKYFITHFKNDFRNYPIELQLEILDSVAPSLGLNDLPFLEELRTIKNSEIHFKILFLIHRIKGCINLMFENNLTDQVYMVQDSTPCIDMNHKTLVV